jgi:hypothetical protein
MVTSREDLDLRELRAHVGRDHPDIVYPAPDDPELLGQHLQSHVQRYSAHVHVTPVAELRISGPLVSVQPEGWITGKGAMPRAQWLRQLRDRADAEREPGQAAEQP